MEIIKRIVDKCLSARFILAIIGGVAFLWCVVRQQIEGATITAILMAIFKDYFDRKDRGDNGKNP